MTRKKDEPPPQVHHHTHHHVHHPPPHPQREYGPPDIRRPGDHFDALGRKAPKRIGMLMSVRVVPTLASEFLTEVPPEAVIAAEGEDELSVRCRCGHLQQLAYDLPIRCDGDCGRWFWHIGRIVRVARAEQEAA